MKKLLCVLMFGMVFGQAELTTRVYQVELNANAWEIYTIDISDLTGHELDSPVLILKSIDNLNLYNPENYSSFGINHMLYSLEEGNPERRVLSYILNTGQLFNQLFATPSPNDDIIYLEFERDIDGIF